MIIYRVEIENFYSVRERQVIDLTVRGTPPDDSKKVVKIGEDPDTWVPRVVAVFGANASGKTNVLRAISYICDFARASAFGPATSVDGYYKFGTPDKEDSPTRLLISFASNRDLLSNERHSVVENNFIYKYTYEVELSAPDENNVERVIRESLKCLSGISDREICIFERHENGKIKIFDKISSYNKLETLEYVLRPGASIISTLRILNDQFAADLALSMGQTHTNINEGESSKNYSKKYFEDKGLLESLNSDLERFDFGVSSVDAYEGIDDPFLYFNHDGLPDGIGFWLESQGTKRFVAIYPILRDALEKGGIAVIDEFDISLHPMMLPEIVGWFEDPQRNPHGAQLWITCHSITLMRNLVKEGIVICEKRRRGSSSVYSLGSMEGVRRNEDFMEGYINGVFGGVPIIG